MEIEVIEFYPIEDNVIRVRKQKKTEGTLHVYLPEHDIDIRGILVKKTGNNWFFVLPFRECFDTETKKFVRYPTFGFANKTKNLALIASIRRESIKYIQEKSRKR